MARMLTMHLEGTGTREKGLSPPVDAGAGG
jgi:hypothetical protein